MQLGEFFCSFPEACGQTHGPGRLEACLGMYVAGNPNSVPLVCPATPRLAREDSVLLTVDNARPKIKGKGSR